jgi:hypothetical protein
MNAKDFGTEIGQRSLWFIIRESARFAFTNPLDVIASIYIIERFGWAGVRFLGLTGRAMVMSQVRLGVEIGKLAVVELGPAAIPQRLAAPATRGYAAVVRAAPSIGRTAGWAVRVGPVGVAAAVPVLLVVGIDMNYELLNDPNSSAYITDDTTGEIIGTPYLDGVTGTGYL